MAKGKKTGGRKEGSQNKVSRGIKEAVLNTFNRLQDHDTANLYDWGIKNPALFYQIAAKLIPTEVQAKVETVDKQEIILPGGTKIVL